MLVVYTARTLYPTLHDSRELVVGVVFLAQRDARLGMRRAHLRVWGITRPGQAQGDKRETAEADGWLLGDRGLFGLVMSGLLVLVLGLVWAVRLVARFRTPRGWFAGLN